MAKRKPTLLISTIKALTTDELFNIIHSNKYSIVTTKHAAQELHKRGVYG